MLENYVLQNLLVFKFFVEKQIFYRLHDEGSGCSQIIAFDYSREGRGSKSLKS